MIKKGIILAGGTGSRLRPLTNTINKHILPVGRYPMIYHPLHTLLLNNIKDIMIVSGQEHLSTLIAQLGSGKVFGAEFTYRVQDEAGGIAQALMLCQDFVKGECQFAVILGDNVFSKTPDIQGIYPHHAHLFLCPTNTPERFGVALLNNEHTDIVHIYEKPKDHVSDLCVTGLYVYSPDVWNPLGKIEKSSRGEYEITDVNNWYVNSGLAKFTILEKSTWSDAGTHESLMEAFIMMKDVIYE